MGISMNNQPSPTSTSIAVQSPDEQQHPPPYNGERSPASQDGEQLHHDESSFSMSQVIDDEDASFASTTNEYQKHPKGKRKRTTATDKKILEEAYSSNPKPDKAARLNIVQRVSLNEKEVQIWFQNRRQNDRRKSRPLSAEEIAALRYSGVPSMCSDPIPSSSAGVAPEGQCPASDPAGGLPHSSQALSCPSPPPSSALASLPASISMSARVEGGLHQRSLSEVTPRRGELPSSQESFDGHQLSQSFSGSVGYLANRWNPGSSISTPSQPGYDGDELRRAESVLPTPSHGFESYPESQCSSQSSVRIRMSLDGKAELISKDASPSKVESDRSIPNLELPEVRQRTLQRSQSALPSLTLPPITTLTSALPPPRSAHGRSRDVNAWERCADADPRDKLTAQAENESSGSAIAAISLLRESSGILQSSSATKRNAPSSKSARGQQSLHQPFKRVKISRANSSVARLETPDKEVQAKNAGADGKLKISMLVSPTDSDKENWSPTSDNGEAQQTHRRRRPLPTGAGVSDLKASSRRLGRVLQEQSKGPAFLSSRANTAPVRRQRKGQDSGAVDIFEDGGENAPGKTRGDDEVERFMRGEVSPSKKGDFDCVAGLLSLSQGAWR